MLQVRSWWMTFAGLVACGSQDARDQAEVRRLCGLPAGTMVVEWHGYPSQVGFGQREGLTLQGVFATPSSWTPSGYQPLPWPEAHAVVEKNFGVGALLDVGRSARCETAGNNVLYAAATRPCTSTPDPLDVIVCVVSMDGRSVSALVRSRY